MAPKQASPAKAPSPKKEASPAKKAPSVKAPSAPKPAPQPKQPSKAASAPKPAPQPAPAVQPAPAPQPAPQPAPVPAPPRAARSAGSCRDIVELTRIALNLQCRLVSLINAVGDDASSSAIGAAVTKTELAINKDYQAQETAQKAASKARHEAKEAADAAAKAAEPVKAPSKAPSPVKASTPVAKQPTPAPVPAPVPVPPVVAPAPPAPVEQPAPPAPPAPVQQPAAPPAPPAVPDVDCVGAFGALGACSATACGTAGTRTQTFSITTQASGKGKACANADGAQQSVPCQAAACPPPPPPAPTGPAYKIVNGILCDDKGRTLYQNTQETDSTVTCDEASGCGPFWPNPPVLDGTGLPGAIGRTTKDGKTYPTYKGRPLYYFGGDRQPGQQNGNGSGTFVSCRA